MRIPWVTIMVGAFLAISCASGEDDDDDDGSAACTGLTPEGEVCVDECDEAYDVCVEACGDSDEDPVLCEADCSDTLSQCENDCYDEHQTTEPCDDTTESGK